MTKSLYHIFARLTCITALAFLMFSCTSNPIDSSSEEQEPINDEDAATLQVILHCSDALREGASVNKQETEKGVKNETTINNATLYLFHSGSKLLYKHFRLSGLHSESNDSAYDASYTTDSLRIHVGTYDLFVIANCNYLPESIYDETEFLNSVDTITYKDGVIQSIPVNGLVMTNRPYSNIGQVLSYSETVQKVNIDLERVLGKVSITLNKVNYPLNDPSGKTYANVFFSTVKVINAPRKYYFFRHTAELESFTKPAEGYDYFSEKDEETNDNIYVIDPCFFDKKTESPDTTLIDSYYAESYRNPDFTIEAPIGEGVPITLYFTENPVYRNSQKKAYVTGLLFKAGVNLHGSVWYWDETTGSIKEDTVQVHWPDTLYFYNYKFYNSIRDLNRCNGHSYGSIDSIPESKQGCITDKELKQYHAKQIVRVLGVYQTKYAYWLRHHNNNNDDEMGPKEFYIDRNSYYKFSLKSVTGIGKSESDASSYLDDVEPNSYTDAL